jgi:mono/diheme cytochrome c family protein
MKNVSIICISTAILATFLVACVSDNQETIEPKITACSDTTAVTFSQHIKPIFSNNCESCHNNNLANSGYNLQDYDNIKQSINRGNKVINSIKWISGADRMPQGSNQLSACQIQQIDLWIQAGMPNN